MLANELIDFITKHNGHKYNVLNNIGLLSMICMKYLQIPLIFLDYVMKMRKYVKTL